MPSSPAYQVRSLLTRFWTRIRLAEFAVGHRVQIKTVFLDMGHRYKATFLGSAELR